MTAMLRNPEQGLDGEISRQMKLVLDPWIVIPAAVVLVLSLISLFSVVYHPVAFEINPDLHRQWSTPFSRQLLWAVLGAGLMLWCAFLDLDRLARRSRWIYAGGCLLLLAVLLFGVKVRNIRAWISLGLFTFQPAELVKIALVISLAAFLSTARRLETPIRSLIAAAFIVAMPAALVLKQPDMGTVLVYLSLLLTVPFASGLPSSYLILILVSGFLAGIRILATVGDQYLGLISSPAMRFFLFDPALQRLMVVVLVVAGAAIAIAMRILRIRHALVVFLFFALPITVYVAAGPAVSHLKEYQKMRLFSFMAPQLDPQGSGYNLLQSQIALGSGSVLGRGLRGATQSALGFLPERQTDFIFSVIGEIFGLTGTTLVILAFAILCLRILWVATQARTRFGALLCVGTATILLVHAFVNIGMAVGVMPIMGIPLPLASYGGTALVTVCMLLGLVQAVERDLRL